MEHRQFDHYEVLAESPKNINVPEIILFLNRLQFPDNIAGIFRVANTFRVKEIFIHDSDVILESKQFRSIARVRAGQVPFYSLASAESFSTLENLEKDGFELVALEFTNQSIPLQTFVCPKKLVLIVGSERHGVDAEILQKIQKSVHIPMLGDISSLNVNQAASIALWHCISDHLS